MTDQAKDEPGEERERLERDADRVRSELMDDLDELKARGRSIGDAVRGVEATVRRHPGIVIGAGAAALVACGIVFFAGRSRHRRERNRDAILALAGRVLGPAYVVEPAAAQSSALTSSLKKATRTLLEAAGREVGRRALLSVQARLTELEPAGNTHPA